jgi:type II secretory pathway pseudopilin PulG
MRQPSQHIDFRSLRATSLAPGGRTLASKRRQREGGYLLLAIMLMMAFMVITLTYVVGPSLVQQIKRDREEEMIHRGTEYMRAIKKFYKKNGRYPASLDDLDKGQIRFLRKRYTDPLAKDGKWKLLHYADIATLVNTSAPGVPAGALGQQGNSITPGGALVGGVPNNGGAANSGFGSLGYGSPIQQIQQSVQQQQQYQGQNPGTATGFPITSDQGGSIPINTGGFVTSGGSGYTDQQSGTGGNQTSGFGSSSFGSGQGQNQGQGQSNSIFGQNTVAGNSQFGGGAIVGVASVDKEKTIRIYNKKKTYDEWQFIYNPAMDQQNVLLRGPYQPTTIGNTNIGTPASQLNGQQGANGQQNSPFGQQNSGFGQQNSGFGQQNGFGQQSGFGQQNSPQSFQPLGGGSGQTPQQ